MKTATLLVLFFSLIFGEAFAQVRQRRSGRLIVKMKNELTLKRSGINFSAIAKRMKFKGIRKRSRTGLLEIGREIASTQTEEQMAQELMASGAVEYAEPDYVQEPAFDPNDSKFPQQWMHQKMDTPAAWDYSTGSEEIIVAVCDSGVDASHPDLQGRVLRGYNAFDGSTNTTPRSSHGTSVAGLMAAAGGDQFGMAGMSWKSKILPIRICNSSSGCSAYTSDMAECIEYAADQGAKIINLSFTGFESKVIDDAAKYARSKGSLLFMAAGNAGRNVTGSPDYASFILVGASTSTDGKASYSNYGTPIDLMAPGHEVLSSTVGGGHASINGTSFASPVAAGLGALVWSINPDFTPDQIEQILYASTDYIGSSSTFGNGRVHAEKAILLALKESSADVKPVARGRYPSGRIIKGQIHSFSAENSTDDLGILKYEWDMGDGTIHKEMNIQHTFQTAGDYRIKLTVWDTSNQSASTEVTLKVYSTEIQLMGVKNINMTVFYTWRTSRTESKVEVKNESGALIPNATVKAIFDNGTTASAVTNSAGVALIKGPTISKKKHLHTITIQSIQHEGHDYDARINVISKQSIQVR